MINKRSYIVMLNSIEQTSAFPLSPGRAPRACPAQALSFSNAASALQGLLAEAEGPLALLFGYIHRDRGEKSSPSQRFAQEVLPQLKSAGYSELVLEIFPVGEPGSPIEQELSEFNRSGQIGKLMEQNLPLNDQEFRLILQEAYRLGIRIHSGGESARLKYQNGLPYRRDLETIKADIADNSHWRVANLVRQGRKTAWFGGCSHNDLAPEPSRERGAFGWRLQQLFPGEVAEIDLVIPESAAKDGLAGFLPLPSNCAWENFIPEQGRSLVRSGMLPSYLLYWPGEL